MSYLFLSRKIFLIFFIVSLVVGYFFSRDIFDSTFVYYPFGIFICFVVTIFFLLMLFLDKKYSLTDYSKVYVSFKWIKNSFMRSLLFYVIHSLVYLSVSMFFVEEFNNVIGEDVEEIKEIYFVGDSWEGVACEYNILIHTADEMIKGYRYCATKKEFIGLMSNSITKSNDNVLLSLSHYLAKKYNYSTNKVIYKKSMLGYRVIKII